MLVDILVLILSLWCHSLVLFEEVSQTAIPKITFQWQLQKFSLEVESAGLSKLTYIYIPTFLLVWGFRTSLLRLVVSRFGKSFMVQGLAQAAIFLNSTIIWLMVSTLDATFGWPGVCFGYAVFAVNVLLKILFSSIGKNSYNHLRPTNQNQNSRSNTETDHTPPPAPSSKSTISTDPPSPSSPHTTHPSPSMDANLPPESPHTLPPNVELLLRACLESPDHYHNYCPPRIPSLFLEPSPSPARTRVSVPSPPPLDSPVFISAPKPKPKPAASPIKRSHINFRDMDLNWDEEEEEEKEKMKKEEEEKEKMKKEEEEKEKMKKEEEEKEKENNDNIIMPFIDTSSFPTPSAPYLPHVLLYEGVDDDDDENEEENEDYELQIDVAKLMNKMKDLDFDDDVEMIDITYIKKFQDLNSNIANSNDDFTPPPASIFYAPSAPPLPNELGYLANY